MASSDLTRALLLGGMGGGSGAMSPYGMAMYDPAALGAMQRLQMGQGLVQEGMSAAPAYPMQAVSRLGQALLGAMMLKRGFGDLSGLQQQQAGAIPATHSYLWGDGGGVSSATPASLPVATTDTSTSTASPPAGGGNANYAALYGNPAEKGWDAANLTTVTSPSGASFQVNKKAADAFKGFLGDLEAAGYKVGAGSGGYNLRNVTGGTTLSPHAYGAAIDINPTDNPYSKTPEGGTLTTNLPPNVGQLAAKWGLDWGGNWQSLKDPMHFEFKGASPNTQVAQAGTVATDATAAPNASALSPQSMPQPNGVQTGMQNPQVQHLLGVIQRATELKAAHPFPLDPVGREADAALEQAKQMLSIGNWMPDPRDPNKLVNTLSGEQKLLVTGTGRFGTTESGQTLFAPPGGGPPRVVAANPSGITGNSPEANAMRTIAELGPKIANGTATPQDRANYSTAAEFFQGFKTEVNPADQSIVRVPQRSLPPGMPNPETPFNQGGATGATPPKPGEPTASTASPNGVTKLTPGGPPVTAVDKRYDAFHTLETTALGARDELQQAQLLKQTLHELGSTGPATPFLANLSRYAAQAGVPEETIKKFGLPPGATETQAAALANALVMEIARAGFPQRITNNDLQFAQSVKPNPSQPLAAADFLIDNTIVPRANRDIQRYGSVVNLTNPKHADYDPSLGSLNAKLYEFDQGHSLSSYTPKLTGQGNPAPQSAASATAPDRAALEAEMRRRGLLK